MKIALEKIKELNIGTNLGKKIIIKAIVSSAEIYVCYGSMSTNKRFTYPVKHMFTFRVGSAMSVCPAG